MTGKQVLAAAVAGRAPVLIGYAILALYVRSFTPVDSFRFGQLLNIEGQFIVLGVALAVLGGILGGWLLIRSRSDREPARQDDDGERPTSTKGAGLRVAIFGGLAGGLVSIPIQIGLILCGSLWLVCYLAKGC